MDDLLPSFISKLLPEIMGGDQCISLLSYKIVNPRLCAHLCAKLDSLA